MLWARESFDAATSLTNDVGMSELGNGDDAGALVDQLDRFSTDAVAPADRVAYWREVICALYVELSAEPTDAEVFEGTIRARQWSDVTISRVVAGGQAVAHPESDARDECLVSMQIAGTGIVSQAGRDVVLGPGDFSMYDASRPYELHFDGDFEQVVLQFPRRLLLDRNIDVERAVAVRNARGAGLTDVVTSLVGAVESQPDQLPAEVRLQLGIQIVDCVASALSLQGFGQVSTETKQSARRRQVVDFLVTNSADTTLTVEQVAASLGCSMRTLQKLFAGGPSVQAQLRKLRLQRASVALTNPMLAHWSIARVGAENGFSDPAAFARAFRREFDTSP